MNSSKTKALLVSTIIWTLLIAPNSNAAEYEVDPIHSSIIFNVTHLNTGNVYGAFTDFSGEFTYNPDIPGDNKIAMAVNVASINTFVEARDNHLRNPDFFNAELHPTTAFESSSWEKVAEDEYKVSGDFTLLGVTNQIEVDAKKIGSNVNREGTPIIGFEFTFTIKRSDFGMDYFLQGLSDEIPVIVAIEGVQKHEE